VQHIKRAKPKDCYQHECRDDRQQTDNKNEWACESDTNREICVNTLHRFVLSQTRKWL